jgi:hypothetical protein
MIASYAFDIKRSFLILLPGQFARFPKHFVVVLAFDRGANENKITETIWKPPAFLSRSNPAAAVWTFGEGHVGKIFAPKGAGGISPGFQPYKR